MVWQLAEVEGEFSAAQGRKMKILPPMSGWAALLEAKALLAKAAAHGMPLLPATVALRLPASTALWKALPATGHHQVANPMMGPMPLVELVE